jgi:hypothetical protein
MYPEIGWRHKAGTMDVALSGLEMEMYILLKLKSVGSAV